MVIEIIKAVVQIFFLAFLFYSFYITLTKSMSEQIVKTVVLYATLYVVCLVLRLDVITNLLHFLAIPTVVFICVLYQPEFRRAFAPGLLAARKKFFRIGSALTSSENIDSVVSACNRLSQLKRGALIVFPRRVSIKNIIDNGTKLNADISSALITTVFDHDSPLHDGAMIIQGAKIVAAGCYLPLSQQTNINQSFGTRHRAALGLAEESDAVVIIVSEESRAISLAYGSVIYYNLDNDLIKSTLIALFNNLDSQIINLEALDGK